VSDFDVIIAAHLVDNTPEKVVIFQNSSNISGEGIFTVNSGRISVNNISFLHNNDIKGAFISIKGKGGSAELKSCTIYGSSLDSNSSHSLYPFLLFMVNNTNNNGVLILNNTTFSNIYFENKSCIECKGNMFVFISNSKFINISSTGCGSCINVTNITVLNIISCEFNNASSSGDGGSIYFGEGSFSLTVNLSTFSSCSSMNGNGGAIAYGSNSGSYVGLHDDTFNGNIAGSGKKGNDYCDVSSDNSSLVLYNCSSITSIITNSLSDKFFHISSNHSLDIFLTSFCNSNYTIYYININNGNDVEGCGSLLSYCKTFEHTMNNISTYPKGIIINIGDYYFSNVSLSSKKVLVAGMIHDYFGNFEIDEINSYPSIISNITIEANNLAVFHLAQSSGIFEYLKLLFSPNSYNKNYFFFSLNIFNIFIYYLFINVVNGTSSLLKINYCLCSTTSVGPGSYRINPFIYQSYGNITVVNCLFIFF
jgi:hypothetical protein